MTEALKEASEQLAQREGAKATMVFAYRPGDRAQGFYTLGRATCAPNGKWEDAGKSGPLQVVVDLNTEDKELGIAATPEVTPKLSATKVRCNKFRIDAQEVGHMVKVSLDTDLPGDTELMVEVGRDYRAVVDGKADTYTEDYLEEKSTVAEWRREHNIDVSDSIFRQKLRSTEDRLTAAGIRNKRRDVSSQIAVRFTVPINQANQEFGKGNANLQGPASIVTRRGSWNIIQREKTLRVPLKSK